MKQHNLLRVRINFPSDYDRRLQWYGVNDGHCTEYSLRACIVRCSIVENSICTAQSRKNTASINSRCLNSCWSR